VHGPRGAGSHVGPAGHGPTVSGRGSTTSVRPTLWNDGFDASYRDERIAATITRSDDPLPELASPSPSPTLALPTIPGLATPALPTIPGPLGATPVRTDEMGLPALP
jgi:hypothetical protein